MLGHSNVEMAPHPRIAEHIHIAQELAHCFSDPSFGSIRVDFSKFIGLVISTCVINSAAFQN